MERILILEDDAALGAGIRMALQTPETEAVLCHTLKDARRTLMQEAFSLLILDINLPDGSGLELLREQKSIRPEVPVILLTANDLELDEVTGLEAGADDYITKPFSLSVLRARVAVQLRRGGIRGGKRAVRYRKTASGQAGSGTGEAAVPPDGIRRRLYLGGRRDSGMRMDMIGYLVIAAGAGILTGLGIALWSRLQVARTYRRMEEMLEAAADGSFSERDFDESRLSALESRLRQYLDAGAVSAEKQKKREEQISALISDISHQTRTPVANLQLYAGLLEEQPLPPQAEACVGAIRTQAEKLQSLIEALVKASRLETGILTLHPEPGEIGPVVERAVSQYAPKASEKKISLTVKNTRGNGVFDPKWTEEALCNLLDNAVKYTPPDGSVIVEVREYEMFSAIQVTDTGPGIPEEQAEIFGRFYRSPSAWQAEGVGIGLYLTRQIASGQGGYVKVKSEPGGGSTFSLYFPGRDRSRAPSGA